MPVNRAPAEGRISFHGNSGILDGGLRVRALSRHLATVVTMHGDLDARHIEAVTDYVLRLFLIEKPLIVDLSDVTNVAAQGISLFLAVDDACLLAELQWVLVPSRAVSRLLRSGNNDGIVPTADSVPAAMVQFAHDARARNRLIPLVTKTA